MYVVKHRSAFFALTGALVFISLVSIFVFGLNFGTDFTGGTLVEVSYESIRTSADVVEESLRGNGLEGFSLRESGELGYTLRTGELTDEQRDYLAAMFTIGDNSARIDQLTEVGPTIGKELRNKAIIAIVLVMVCILFFIAFAFRKVSKPVSSWMYGLIAIVTLLHDVIIPLGAFALFGYIWGARVDALFVTALLTILGFSVHDTIVVFDRVRENLRLNQERNKKEDFAETAGRSLSQTMVRSINTSVTVAISLLALYVLGPVSTQDFALTMLIGIIAGTYSSIFVATPLLVVVERRPAAPSAVGSAHEDQNHRHRRLWRIWRASPCTHSALCARHRRESVCAGEKTGQADLFHSERSGSKQCSDTRGAHFFLRRGAKKNTPLREKGNGHRGRCDGKDAYGRFA
jgi:preprotein translocase subunit SecF